MWDALTDTTQKVLTGPLKMKRAGAGKSRGWASKVRPKSFVESLPFFTVPIAN